MLSVLLFSYLNSMRVYFRQQAQLAETRAQIAQHEREIATLDDELARWQDPDYVRAQARIRLGWVVPGEVGYKVIGPDGKPLGATVELEQQAGQDDDHGTQWWERLLGSIKTADDPAPASDQPTPTSPPTTVRPPSTPPSTVRPSSTPSR